MGIFQSKLELTDAHYIKPVEHDVFSEGMVELPGERKSKRHVAQWVPKEGKPKAIVVISHGLHEHALRYYSVAHALTSKHYAVYAIDHCGHGKSASSKDEWGFVPDYNIMVDDFASFAAYARSLHEDLPLFVVAHSMGTLVAMLAVKNIPNVGALVLSGAAVKAGPAAASPFGCECLYPVFQGPSGVSVAECMAGCAPRAPAAPIDAKGITSDPAQLAILMADPRRYSGEVMNKTGFEVLKMIEAVKTQIGTALTVPFLCLHGSEDKLALVEGSHFIFKNAGTPQEHRRIEVLEGQLHEIFHEKKVSRKSESPAGAGAEAAGKAAATAGVAAGDVALSNVSAPEAEPAETIVGIDMAVAYLEEQYLRVTGAAAPSTVAGALAAAGAAAGAMSIERA